jgi:hypothetical protein
MRKILLAVLLLTSMSAMAETTYYSDGTYSQTYSDGRGGYNTYNSDGSYSYSR